MLTAYPESAFTTQKCFLSFCDATCLILELCGVRGTACLDLAAEFVGGVRNDSDRFGSPLLLTFKLAVFISSVCMIRMNG